MVIFEEERRRRREVERTLGEAGKRLPEAGQSHHSIQLSYRTAMAAAAGAGSSTARVLRGTADGRK